jgi:hypothetical protein
MATKKFVPTVKQSKVEDLARLNAELRATKAQIEKLKAYFLKVGGRVDGLGHYVQVYEMETSKLDVKKVKRLLGERAYNSCVVHDTVQAVKLYKAK